MNPLVHVFAGPSLPPSVQPQLESFVFHEPASQGDVFSLVASRPFAIAIIDGYFERVPAVWHKEILWALSEGVHVFGSSSMGALRAAELADFGMVGLGGIFEDFVNGRLEDDDEVTIVHADAGEDYRPGSEAMVNIRATLALARDQGALSADAARALTAHAKALFYPDRSYPALLSRAREELPATGAQAFHEWIKVRSHRVDLKRRDALQLLDHLQKLRLSGTAPKRVPWSFQHTDAWEQVRRSVSSRADAPPGQAEDADAQALHQLAAEATTPPRIAAGTSISGRSRSTGL